MNNNNKEIHSRRTVPTFSWEEKPGISKPKTTKAAEDQEYNRSAASEAFEVKLPPPPGPTEKYRASFHEFQIPLPPCAFQPPQLIRRNSSRRKNDDPFLIAYIECTKSSKSIKSQKLAAGDDDSAAAAGGGLMKKKNMSVFSNCKNSSSCSVVDDSIIKISQLPISRSRREN